MESLLLDERLLSSVDAGISTAAAASAAGASGVSARMAPGNIRSLILEKEKELHDINEYRIRTLEALLRDKVRRRTHMPIRRIFFSFLLLRSLDMRVADKARILLAAV